MKKETDQHPLFIFITYLNIKLTDKSSVWLIIKTPHTLFAEAIQCLKGRNAIKQLFNNDRSNNRSYEIQLTNLLHF